LARPWIPYYCSCAESCFCKVILFLNVVERFVAFMHIPVFLKPANLVVRIKEHRHNVGRIEVGLKVILIKLLLAKVDARLEVGGFGIRDLLFSSLKVRENEVHCYKHFM
jgi:hypothetical protein